MLPKKYKNWKMRCGVVLQCMAERSIDSTALVITLLKIFSHQLP